MLPTVSRGKEYKRTKKKIRGMRRGTRPIPGKTGGPFLMGQGKKMGRRI